MILSQYTKQLCKSYNLTPEQIYICTLVAGGIARPEAWQIVTNHIATTDAAATKSYNNLVARFPNMNNLINDLQQKQLTTNAKRAANLNRLNKRIEQAQSDLSNLQTVLNDGEGNTGGGVGVLRTKQAVLNELEKILPSLVGKERADVVMKIADLQRMKNDENEKETALIHYYLPVKCSNCKFNKLDK